MVTFSAGISSMEKRNMKNLSYILFGFVLLFAFFYMLNESKKKEQFANESSSAWTVITYILIGVVSLFFIGAVLAMMFGKV
jgi:uncharacterized membrane protein YfcA